MMYQDDHASAVDAWLLRAARDLPIARRVALFDRAFGALWRRISSTLGEITLWAIANRVVRASKERYPWLSSVRVEPGGIGLKALCDAPAESLNDDAGALRFLLIELLRIIGSLTGEILTPELHAELSRVTEDRQTGVPREGATKGRTKEQRNDR